MNSIVAYFSTDWSAMTHADWSGLVIVSVLTVLMAGLYFWVFNPKNRDQFEQHRDFVNEKHESTHREVGHGQAK
ncbi:MAG: CcoQ/FixQ family Cbb3-type cytochrome c oxidase assembly chaperone [Mariprofundaceae bacterium]